LKAVYARDYLRAIEKLSPLAQQGNEDAQYWLAISYRMGRPSEDFSDLENEYKWYLAAAEGGNAYAMYRLGKGKYLACELLQDCKNGAEIWEKKAIAKWRTRAAAGSGDAMLELAYRDHNWFTRLPLINNLVGWTRLREALATGSTYAVLEYATKARRSGSSEKSQ